MTKNFLYVTLKCLLILHLDADSFSRRQSQKLQLIWFYRYQT